MKVPPPGDSAKTQGLPHVEELFADREGEANAFKEALTSFRRLLDRDDEVGAARSNILAFHGMGGVGKSTLSERLEGWIGRKLPLENGWGSPPATRVSATGRMDLHESAGQMDALATLLALRLAVAQLKPRWPVFDLAFSAYWSSVRPGEPLPSYRGSTQMRDAVLETLADALGDVGNAVGFAAGGTGAGGTLAVSGVRRLVSEIRRRRDVQLGVSAFQGFEEFLTRCVDEPSPSQVRHDIVCEIAATLAWELAQISSAPLVCLFVDATERLSLDPKRVAEKQLNQLIFSLPNVLFVLTGRDMLDWGDEARVDLDNRGPLTWPGLVPGTSLHPRQHLLGTLSNRDSLLVIERGRRILDLPMPSNVVNGLATASGGLPIYIELALQTAISVKAGGSGRQVRMDEVTGSLSSLVSNLLYDVPPDEQRAIRAASLFQAFDTDLIAAAANVDHGCAERAVGRPMIEHNAGGSFPYRMHDAVRTCIRSADASVSHGWHERDWQLASTRAAVAVHRLHIEAKKSDNTRAVLDAVGLAIELACDQETELEESSSAGYRDWLTQAIVYSPSIQSLRSRIPGSSRTTYGQLVLDFVEAKSYDIPVTERLELLRKIFESNHPLSAPAGRHLGYALKTLYKWEEALGVFSELIARYPSAVNRRQVPQTLSLARRFIDARRALDAAPDPKSTVTRTDEYAHGRPERYFSEIGSKIAMLKEQGRQREYLDEVGDLLARRVLFQGDVSDRETQAFFDEAEVGGHAVAVRSGLMASILNQKQPDTQRLGLLERLRRLDRLARSGQISFRYGISECCDALLAGDSRRLERLSKEVSAIERRSRSWIPVECFLEAAGFRPSPVTTQWLEPYETVAARWHSHLERYLAFHR